MAGNHKSGRKRGVPRALSPAQKAFVYQYCALNFNLDATCKVRRVSYNTARNWLSRADVKEFLAQHQEIIGNCVSITAAEVLGRLISLSRADIGDILPDVDVVKEARRNGVSHWIKKIKKRTIHRKGGETEEIVELEIHDSAKALVQACKLMGLEARDDELDRARTAIRVAMDLNGWSAEEAISRLAPHYPGVVKVRDEFLGTGPVIDLEAGLLESGSIHAANSDSLEQD